VSFLDTALLPLMTAPAAAHRIRPPDCCREHLLFSSRSRLAAKMDHDAWKFVIARGQISKYRADVNSCTPGMKCIDSYCY
jgi:hypothetical protein